MNIDVFLLCLLQHCRYFDRSIHNVNQCREVGAMSAGSARKYQILSIGVRKLFFVRNLDYPNLEL